MKPRLIILSAILALSAAALYYAQRHKTDNKVGAEGVLNALADTQREMSRVPAELTRVSDEEEIRIGNGMAENYVARFSRMGTDDTAMQSYVTTVGIIVSGRARRKLPYQFHYIPDPSFINAFALPGGHVFIGKGLIQLMKSEDEMAAVLGHELEHIDDYHCVERVQVQAQLRKLPLGELIGLPIEIFQAGYNKEQELEADRDGTYLAVMAGYSASGAIHVFETFEKLHREYITKAESPDQELSQVAIQVLAGYFRSHPLPQEREAQIQHLIAARKWPERPEKALRVLPQTAKTAMVQ